MHESFFEYSLSRPYPFRWFTPIVVVLGLIVVVVFSLINFATSSYTLAPRYTNDPNTTVIDSHLHWPDFLASKLQPTCQAVSIPVNTQVLTNNSALTYTLTDVLQNAGDASQRLSPALVYPNSILPDCNVTSISLQLSSLARTAAQIALIHWGVIAQASITCKLDNENQGITKFNMTAEYNMMPPTVSIFSNFYGFVGRNLTSKASLYWGESLLSMYWLKLASDVDNVHIRMGNQVATSGTIFYTFNGSTTDISSPAFFDVQWRFIVPQTDNTHSVYYGSGAPSFTSNDPQVNLGVSADTLAKSMYSTVLTDLGQANAPANILTSPALLQYFTANFTKLIYQDSRGGPATGPYIPGQSEALGVSPSVFGAFYLCQVPQRKSTGSMLLAILVADLVFLQAVWMLWKMAVEAYMKRRDPQTYYCEGCHKARHGQILVDGHQHQYQHEYPPPQSQSPLLSRRRGNDGYKMVPVVNTERSFGPVTSYDIHA